MDDKTSRIFVTNLLVTEGEISGMLKQLAMKDDPIVLRKASSDFLLDLD